jgi:hypothetical protein
MKLPDVMSQRFDPYQSQTDSSSPQVSDQILAEERGTLSRQYEMMQHIDDRAMRITRTSAVILGIILTGLSLLLERPEGSAELTAPALSLVSVILGSSGAGLLTFSLIIGVVTTQYSQPIYGIGERVRHGISSRRNPQVAISELSEEYDDGIAVMQGRLERNRDLLWIVQILFIFGLVLLLAGSCSVLLDAVEAA